MPRGGCDTHVHVFGPQAKFPFSPARSYTPEDCTLEDLNKLHATLGIDRVVIVHGGAHGTDNTATLDALDRRSTARGVAVIQPGLPRDVLADMHRRGMRGCRMSTVVSGGAGMDKLEALAAETAEFDWHLVLHFNRSSELVDVAPRLIASGRPFVLDHMARVTADEGVSSPAFQTLLRLLDTDRCWVKLASLYRLSSEPYPHHRPAADDRGGGARPSGPAVVGQQLAASHLPCADAERRRSGRSHPAVAAGCNTFSSRFWSTIPPGFTGSTHRRHHDGQREARWRCAGRPDAVVDADGAGAGIHHARRVACRA